MTRRVLILGGTTEAKQLAGILAVRQDWEVTLSLAGRTRSPAPQPCAVRTGGFGGAEGLAAYLRQGRIDLLIDATHPSAARISRNAANAAGLAGVRFLALRRPAWEAVEGDRWTLVADARAAVAALGSAPRRLFLALGRQEIAGFAAVPQHRYWIRSVDPVEPPLDVPDATYLLGRGPFREADELAFLRDNRIEAIVAKNSGGQASYGKIAAARQLGIAVILLERPALPEAQGAASVAELIATLDQEALPENRGE